jgi:hypothetical protein
LDFSIERRRHSIVNGEKSGQMDKRLAKRHKRQVSRAKQRVVVSEPDLRTPEQIKAAREASRHDPGHGSGRSTPGSAALFRNSRRPATGSAAKTDA